MELTYRVHGLSLIQRDDTVTYRGKEIKAPVDCLEVELEHATEPSVHGSLVMRFFGDDIKTAQEQFAASSVRLFFGPVETPQSDPAVQA